MTFGQTIKVLRTALGLTQYQAAELIEGVDASKLSKYENDKHDPLTPTRTKILGAYAKARKVKMAGLKARAEKLLDVVPASLAFPKGSK